MDIKELYPLFLKSTGVSTDTRTITQGQIFFALRGDNFNGSAYAEKAINLGASYAVIDDPKFEIPGKTILVSDVLKTLQDLSGYHRRQFDIPIIAITGSNGKTTSKELTGSVLGCKFNTLYTQGNLNNHIGVPLTLLRLSMETEIAVIEMGANHQREIDLLCRIAEPTHGYICSIGKAHLEGFGGIEGVKKGKGELYDYLLQNNGMIFINLATPYLKEILGERKGNIFRYGLPNTEIYGEVLSEQPFVSGNIFYKEKKYLVSSHLIGTYNFGNILNTFVLGVHFGVSENDIVHAIESYRPENNRSEVRKIDDYELILDAYNANPTSLSNAIEYFDKRPEKHKILIVGDMFELGEDSQIEHQKIIDQIQKMNIDTVVLIGPLFTSTIYPEEFIVFPKSTDARNWWAARNKKGAVVLVKGSRGMGLEKIFD